MNEYWKKIVYLDDVAVGTQQVEEFHVRQPVTGRGEEGQGEADGVCQRVGNKNPSSQLKTVE